MNQERGPEGREGQPGREGAQGREGLPGIPGLEGTEGEKGEKGETGSSITKGVKISFVLVTLLFFLTLVGFSWIIHDVRVNSDARVQLAEQNKQRIKDIQESRTSSCKTTYRGIREVFRPFFPPVPRTPKQQADLDKFNSTIDRLIRQCEAQTKP